MHTTFVLVVLCCATSMLRTTDAANTTLVCENKQTAITAGYRTTTHDNNGLTCIANGGTASGWCMKMTMTQRGPSDANSLS